MKYSTKSNAWIRPSLNISVPGGGVRQRSVHGRWAAPNANRARTHLSEAMIRVMLPHTKTYESNFKNGKHTFKILLVRNVRPTTYKYNNNFRVKHTRCVQKDVRALSHLTKCIYLFWKMRQTRSLCVRERAHKRGIGTTNLWCLTQDFHMKYLYLNVSYNRAQPSLVFINNNNNKKCSV